MKVYMASDIKHAKRWITFRQLCYPKIIVVSSWVDLLADGEPEMTPDLVRESWDNNIKDVILCDVLVLYHELGDRLRGSLFEAGMAFAMGKPVMFVGDPVVLGTLGVCFEHSPTLDLAIMLLHERRTPEEALH